MMIIACSNDAIISYKYLFQLLETKTFQMSQVSLKADRRFKSYSSPKFVLDLGLVLDLDLHQGV